MVETGQDGAEASQAALPRRWKRLRRALLPVGMLVFVGCYLVYEDQLEVQVFDGEDNYALHLMVPAAMALAGLVALALARLPWRRFLLPSLLWQGAGAGALFVGWLMVLTILMAGAGDCYTPGDAEWSDGTTYGMLPNATLGPDEAFVHLPPPSGLVVLDAPNELNLTLLGWTDPATALHITLDPSGLVALFSPSKVQVPDIERTFSSFIADVTGDPTAGERHVASVRAEKEAGYYSSADSVDGEFVAHYRYWVLLETPHAVGAIVQAIQTDPSWDLTVEGPQREILDRDGRAILLALPDGLVHHSGGDAETDEAYLVDLRADMDRWGLPQPEAPQVGGSIC